MGEDREASRKGGSNLSPKGDVCTRFHGVRVFKCRVTHHAHHPPFHLPIPSMCNVSRSGSRSQHAKCMRGAASRWGHSAGRREGSSLPVVLGAAK